MRPLGVIELARLRAEQRKFLSETVYIRRRTQTADGQGGVTDTFADTTTVGRVRPMGQEQTQRWAERLNGVAGWIITLPYDALVTPGDVVRIGADDYTVIGVTDTETDQTALRVACVRVRT